MTLLRGTMSTIRPVWGKVSRSTPLIVIVTFLLQKICSSLASHNRLLCEQHVLLDVRTKRRTMFPCSLVEVCHDCNFSQRSPR
jgi:hypothetical protein